MLVKPNYVSFVDHHRLALKLNPVMVGELYLSKILKHPAYVYRDGVFIQVISEGTLPTKSQIIALIDNSFKEVYLYSEDYDQIKSSLQAALIKVTRSLSIGDPVDNGQKNIKLLCLHQDTLYKDPHNDEVLTLQFQSSLNLGKFLINNKKDHSQFYQNLVQDNFHYLVSQPMLCSILLLSYLQSTKLFQDKEIEKLFLTSYFKDIGLSLIPTAQYDVINLGKYEIELFSRHTDFSFDLLDGRVPLSKNYLQMIKDHHFLNDRLKEIAKSHKGEQLPPMTYGLETVLIGVFDLMVAMTTDRPYRKGVSVYKSLEVVKRLMIDDYPQEFKALVYFLKQFYKN